MSDDLRHHSRRSAKTPGVARHGRLKRSSATATAFKALAAAMAVVFVAGLSVVGIAGLSLASAVSPGVTLENEKTLGAIPQIGAIDGGANVLLVGSDSRAGQGDGYGEDSGDLNDVTMLLHIAQDHSSASVISFPRDMFVPIPECPDPNGGTFDAMSSQKINTTLGYGGLACTVLTVEQLTGLSIPFAAEVQFNGVIAMSDAVGGVPVCVAERIEDEHTDTYLDPGEHTLSGLAALQFLRTRHGVGDGSDLTRISNQQVFLSSLVRTIKSADTLTNPVKLYSLAKAALSNMKLSNSLQNMDTMVSIAMALKDIDLNNVVFVQYPTGSTEGGVEPLEEPAAALNAALLADQPIALTGDTGGSVADPNAPATEEPAATEEPEATEEPSADPEPSTEAPAPTKTPTTKTELDAKGQTAGQYTCSSGRTLDDQ
ncbi:MAG: LCP family protein [Leifsonia flava]